MESLESPQASEGAKILANGTRIQLKDGSYQNLILDFEAIVKLEDKYGSLEEFVAVLQGQGKKFTAIRDAMTACLAHTGMSPSEISQQLLFKHFQKYVEALTTALEEGMPEGLATTPLQKVIRKSPGNGSIGQRRSNSGGRMSSSKG